MKKKGKNREIKIDHNRFLKNVQKATEKTTHVENKKRRDKMRLGDISMTDKSFKLPFYPLRQS